MPPAPPLPAPSLTPTANIYQAFPNAEDVLQMLSTAPKEASVGQRAPRDSHAEFQADQC